MSPGVTGMFLAWAILLGAYAVSEDNWIMKFVLLTLTGVCSTVVVTRIEGRHDRSAVRR